MQHLEDGFLHEIADGEVPSEELVAVREHLETCESCRARLDEARNEAETARELIELIEVPANPSDRLSVEPSVRRSGGPTSRRPVRWLRPVALAASLVLAAGIGYASRSEFAASVPLQIEPTSLGRVDTVFLDIPAQAPASQPAEADRSNLEGAVSKSAAAPPARQRAAGSREEEQALKRRADFDTANAPRDELQVANAVADAKKTESKDANAKLAESAREQPKQLQANRPVPAAPSVAGATAENRLMAKAAPDAAPTIISFPRAIELLGGRLKLIEGMVPARLEAVGGMVRVIYVIDEGNLVLAEVAATDSVNWSLSGPLSADSLEALRRRVK